VAILSGEKPPDPGLNFQIGRWFDEVVIRPEIKSENAVVQFRNRGEHEERDVPCGRVAFQISAEIESILFREEDVHDDQILWIVGHVFQRLAGAIHFGKGTVHVPDNVRDLVSEFTFVLEKQDVRDFTLRHKGSHASSAKKDLLKAYLPEKLPVAEEGTGSRYKFQ